MVREKYLIYPLSPKKMDSKEDKSRKLEQMCRNCTSILEYLKKDYCSIGICAKNLA